MIINRGIYQIYPVDGKYISENVIIGGCINQIYSVEILQTL